MTESNLIDKNSCASGANACEEMEETAYLHSGERVDDLLVNGLKIIQNPDAFCFGCDAVEIANFVTGGAKDRAIDLGSGTGIITILLGGKKGIRCTGVEIQSDMAEMSRRSIAMNGLENMCDIVNAPMQDVKAHFESGCATIVVSNPPYRKKDGGTAIENMSVALARHEIAVTLKEVLDAAAYLTRPGGRFYLIHRADRLAEIIYECKSRKLEPKVLQILVPSEGKSPHLIMLKCVKDGREGIEIMPERVVDTVV